MKLLTAYESQFSAGRLTAIQYPAINYNVYTGSPGGSTTFTDMFSYTQPGSVAGKRLRVTKVQPYGNGLPHTQTAVGDLNMAYSYNYEGKLISVTYPTDVYGTTPQFTYSYDAMMRPAGMTDQNSASIISGVQYGLANELLQMTYIGGATETRQYNSMLQLTNITGLGQNITYTFPPVGQNAGKIASQTDNISGETVNYAYDSLNRLISAGANSNAWSQTYSYDGFGNLTGRMGYGTAQSTTISTPADTTTNRLSGYAYDPNGNQISTGYAYDAENRMVQANAGAIQYAYDAQNKRIWQASFSNSSGDWLLTSDSISVFGIDGKMIGTYNPQPNWNNTQTQITIPFYGGGDRVYFGSKLVAKMGGSGYLVSVAQDRLSSVGKYDPFGEERNSPPLPNDQVKFATYTRDSATGLDYADQRHYASAFGRFMTADPYMASGGPNTPQSWNRYSYVQGDPVNHTDRTGKFIDPELCDDNPMACEPGYQDIGCLFCDDDDDEIDPGLTDQVVANGNKGSARFDLAYGALIAEKNGLGLQFLRAQSEQCEKDLAALGVTDLQVSAAAFGANIINGMTAIFGTFADNIYGNASPQLHNAAVGEFGTINVVQYMTLLSPRAAAVAQINGSNIYINPSWVNGMTPLDQTALLLHEFMHNITGLTDEEIQTQLGLSTKAASQNIGDKLKQDCLQ